MKLALTTLFFFLLCLVRLHENKMDLICQKWRQVGIKDFGKDYKSIDKSMTEVIIFKKDGAYDEELYGSLQIKGQWKFSMDSLKLSLVLTEMNGKTLAGTSFDDSKPIDSIIKLTRDTLIYGALVYFGEQKIYGHDDWYFVREK